MKPHHHEFEGTLRTIAEIRAIVPAFSETVIRNRLKMGQRDRDTMLRYVGKPARVTVKSPGLRGEAMRSLARLDSSI